MNLFFCVVLTKRERKERTTYIPIHTKISTYVVILWIVNLKKCNEGNMCIKLRTHSLTRVAFACNAHAFAFINVLYNNVSF